MLNVISMNKKVFYDNKFHFAILPELKNSELNLLTDYIYRDRDCYSNNFWIVTTKSIEANSSSIATDDIYSHLITILEFLFERKYTVIGNFYYRIDNRIEYITINQNNLIKHVTLIDNNSINILFCKKDEELEEKIMKSSINRINAYIELDRMDTISFNPKRISYIEKCETVIEEKSKEKSYSKLIYIEVILVLVGSYVIFKYI
jgi:hypothetical protein